MSKNKMETGVHPLRPIRLRDRSSKTKEFSGTGIKVTQERSDLEPEVVLVLGSDPNEAAQTETQTESTSPGAADSEDRVVLRNQNTLYADIDKRYQCEKCLKWFSGVKKFIAHLRSHEDAPKCPYCSGTFRRNEISVHMSSHNPGSLYDCPGCEKSYDTHSKLLKHMPVHDEKKKQYSCPECNTGISSLKVLRTHLLSHLDSKSFICSICNKSLKSRAFLRQHERRAHDPNAPVYTCPECGKVSKNKQSMQSHIWIHSGDKVFECDVCGKRYSSPQTLSGHKWTHKATRYKCVLCHRMYKDETALQNHLRSHAGALPYKCMECGAQYLHRQSFKKHVVTHTGEMKVACPICAKVLAHQSYLTMHLKFHENTRDFVCNECGKKFNSKHILTNHSKVHINEKPFKCSYCDHACRYNGNLTKHVRRMHEKKK